MSEETRNVHKFEQRIDLIQPVSLVGQAAVDYGGKQIEQSDEKYWSGIQEARKYSVPMMDLMALAVAKETAKSMRAEINQITITAGQTGKLIKEGKISMSDLGDKQLLKNKLEQVEKLSDYDKRKIVRYRQSAYDLILVKSALENESKAGSLLDEAQREYMASADFYNLGNERTNELLKIYFKNTENDVLRSVSPASMTEKQIGKLKKTAQKNGLSVQDEAALRLVERQIKNRSMRIKAGRMTNIRKRIDRMKSYVYRMDENLAAGIQNMAYMIQVTQAGYAVTKFGLKAGIVTASFAGKYTGVSYLLAKLNHIRQRKMEQAAQAVKAAVRESRPYRKIGEAKAAVKKKVNENTYVQKYKGIQKKAGETRKKAAKKINRTRAAARAAGRRVKQGANIVFSPVRFLGKLLHAFGGALGKLKLALMAGAGIFIALFVLIVVLINSILSACQTQAQTAMTLIMTEDENFIANTTASLQEKVDARRAEAKGIIAAGPQDSSVHGGQALSRYGHPGPDGSWVDDSKLIYVDGSGNPILLGANNIKDAIVAAYIIMDADFDQNVAARDALILDVWVMMNPDIIWEESDIYSCSSGCDTFSYSCDSDADMGTIGSHMSDGVLFFGSIEECPPETDSTIIQSCDGHSVTVCYGHKDLKVYVPVISMLEFIQSGQLPSGQGKNYYTYLQSFEGWTDENIEWAESLYQSDWFELYGTDPSAGSGDMAGTGMSTDQINAILANYGDLDATRAAICVDAMSFVGQIPYYWGGKASTLSYEGNHFYTTVAPDSKGRNQRGLDCSGFVQWIIWRVTDVKLGGSTSTITSGMAQISASELQPGDLGLMAIPGAASNHVGIFVGYDERGQALWCHENSSDGNVSVNATTCFKYYYRIF